MENSEAIKLLHSLQTLIKNDNKEAIYQMMTNDFKSRVSLENYLRLEKYRINLSLPLCLVDIYEAHTDKVMIRAKQASHSDHDIFANMLFVKEEDLWKFSGTLL